jgi:hypothetical protein
MVLKKAQNVPMKRLRRQSGLEKNQKVLMIVLSGQSDLKKSSKCSYEAFE